MQTAIYGGSFDPITFGHLDVLKRAEQCFDQVIIAVAKSTPKDTLFSVEERIDLVQSCLGEDSSTEVVVFDGLIVDFARSNGAKILLRGVRAFSDFDYEFQMALTNRKLAPDIETMFLMPNETYSYLSSSRVREIAKLGGNTENFVPQVVGEALQGKFNR